MVGEGAGDVADGDAVRDGLDDEAGGDDPEQAATTDSAATLSTAWAAARIASP